MFKQVDIPKAMDEAKKTREYISSLTPLQTWHDIRDRVYMIEQLTKVNEDQSKAFRKNYASINFTYDVDKDAFIAPQPFPSWQ